MNKNQMIVLGAVAILVIASMAVVITTMGDDDNNRADVTVTDYVGRKVSVSSVDRIVSVSMNPTAILCGLGVGSNLVGVSGDTGVYSEDGSIIGLTDDDFPKAVRDGLANGTIKDLGGMYNMSAETMISVESDLVVCDTYGTKQETWDALENLGVTFIVVSGTGFLNDIYNNIELLGKAVRKESKANSLISEIKNTIGKIESWCESIVENELNGKKLDVVLMMTTTYAVGDDYLGGEIIKGLCANNAFGYLGRYASVTSESILSANAEVLIYQNLGVGDGVADPAAFLKSLHNHPILGGIDAAKDGLTFATIEGAYRSSSSANQGIARAYAMYAMFIYQDYLTFEIPSVLDSSNYSHYIDLFWKMINS